MLKRIVGIICIIAIIAMNFGASYVLGVDENEVNITENNVIEENTTSENIVEENKIIENNETFEEENCIKDSNENNIPEENVTIQEEIPEPIAQEEMPVKAYSEERISNTQTIKDGVYIIYSGVGKNTCLDVTGGGKRKWSKYPNMERR